MSDKELEETYERAEKDYEELKDKLHDLYEENEMLKELCEKYEEEHKTTFEIWKQGIQKGE